MIDIYLIWIVSQSSSVIFYILTVDRTENHRVHNIIIWLLIGRMAVILYRLVQVGSWFFLLHLPLLRIDAQRIRSFPYSLWAFS